MLRPPYTLRSARGLFWLGLLGAITTSTACSEARGAVLADDSADAASPLPSVDDAGSPATSVPETACPVDNPYCKGDRPAAVPSSCASVPIVLEPVGVNVMVAVEGAASMAMHWPIVRDALRDLRSSHPDSTLGLQIFWGELADSLQSAAAKANWCGETKYRLLDVGDHSAQDLLDTFGNAPPGPSYVGGLFETSPVIEPLNYYLQNDTKLADPKRTNYLVFISNGNDNCFGSLLSSKPDKLLAYEKLAVELGKRNIRIVPIGFDASTGADNSAVNGATANHTDVAVLQTLLDHGGSGLHELPKADDPSKLREAIAKVGQVVRSCRFAIPAALDPAADLNPFAVEFSVGGARVERDRHNREGWNFVAGDTSQVELFGMPCQAAHAGAPVAAYKTCNDNVCGTSSIKVETKPRAVLYLLDSSASRLSCTDNALGCVMLPDSPARVSLTYWEVVEHALGVSLVSAINDDVAFGLQLFPSKAAGPLSCDVADTPEVPPAPGSAITIMSKMLEKLPLGFSPVVDALESVAALPGRLADPHVEGAVVMLTDGGDNCAGASQDKLVARLGGAAATLLAEGVKTYVVRYGAADGNTPEQEAQLRAIAAAGGTASSDPADPSKKPYIDAQTDADLSAALAQISNSLATCTFTVGAVADDADKGAVNLYLNGEVVPFDDNAATQDGWDWLDPEQTTIQLYGQSCEAFKNNRKTSVVVEFGCASVIVI